ncbi:MAG: cytochrome P450 [Spirulina sp. SIO3F2]|nr:cytochrome P450 [Spirulina sp. SIO3F2]
MPTTDLPPTLQTPAFLQILNLVRDPIAFFDHHLAQQGDTFTSRVLGPGGPPVVFVGNPTSVEQIFTAPLETFCLGQVTHVFRPLTGDRSLIMLDGSEHLRQRKLLMPPLHGQRMQVYREAITTITLEVLRALPQNRPITLRPYLADITLQVILRVVFGLEPGPRYAALQTLIAEMLEAITQPFYSSCFFFEFLQQDFGPWSPWGHFVRQMGEIDRLVYAEIRDRRAQFPGASGRQRTDVLSLLLTAHDEAGQGLTDQELRDQLMTLLLLGHETTASSLAWAMYWVLSHPAVYQQLRADPSPSNAQDYLTAVCNETLRLYPIALIAQPRIAKTDYDLSDYHCPAGTVLVPCIYLAHRRPEVFPEPLRFMPERFLNRQFSPAEFFPFGGGHRGCIGMAFSLFEMRLILQTLLNQGDWELMANQQVQPVRRGITIVPSSGVKVRYTASPVPIALALNSADADRASVAK